MTEKSKKKSRKVSLGHKLAYVRSHRNIPADTIIQEQAKQKHVRNNLYIQNHNGKDH